MLIFFAGWTAILGFKATSPYAGQMPSWGQWFRHPIDSSGQFVDVMKLHIIHDSEVARAKRERMISETFKTKAYRVMHGLEPLQGQPTEVQILVAKMKGEYIEGPNGQELVIKPQLNQQRRPLKKWFGIW